MKTRFSFRKVFTSLLVLTVHNVLFAAAPTNDNCAAASPLLTSSSAVACSATQTLKEATSPLVSDAPAGSCGAGVSQTATYDVWFRYTAKTTAPTISLSSLGSELTAANTFIEVLSGTCGSFTSLACGPASSRLTVAGLTSGTTYYIRVYVVTAPAQPGANKYDFNICIQDPPANDDCSGATTLTAPTTTCTNTAGSLDLSSASTGLPAGCDPAGTHYDTWFRFTAGNAMQTITLSSLGVNLTNPFIQLYSGACGALTSIQCGTTSLTATGLTVSTVYYIRVSNVGTNPSGAGAAAFNICVTNPPAAPANDNCTGAISLTPGVNCSNTTGTLVGATASTGIPAGCAGAGTYYDGWYSFTAARTYELITISNPGANLNNPQIQLLSGSCGSLVSIACGTTTMYGTNLTVGATYYVRVSNVGAFVPATGGFSICVYHPAPSDIEYSRSYINVTKGATGGNVSPGDTLEMRATIVITATGSVADSLAFYDTLYNTKGLRLVPGSIALRTNEGKVYRQDSPVKEPFSDAFDTDQGWHYENGPDTIIRINFGTGASNFARGRLTNTSKPSVFGSTCIIMATYRVVVYAGYNSLINFKTGALTYRDGLTGILNTRNFTPNNLIVYQSPGLCPNAVSATNALGGESNGTFGVPTGSPLARNRGTTPYTSYMYNPFTASGGPGDRYYGIANNTSSRFTTINTWTKPDPDGYRVFQQWDITGDHGGSTSSSMGSPPCDTTKAVSSTNPCGYMLVINASYKTDTAFTYTINSLCPNTYYELAAWFKNVCYKCGCDSTGAGSGNTGYIPTATGDSSGVRPNIAFDVNGTDYYTTGDILYYGTTPKRSDSTNIWVKRGFTYLTGPSQTSFTLTLRNNAPGGGGNDWALDDIAVATCSPNLSFTPSSTPPSCSGNVLNIDGTVTSYFNNYSNYKWQISNDAGTTWTDTGSPSTGSPAVNGSGQYVYTVNYQTQVLTTADNGIKFRLVTATTSSNLTSSSCALSGNIDVTPVISNCSPILGIDFISFNGKIANERSVLKWTTTAENNVVTYEVERSINGLAFEPVATIAGHGITRNTINSYTWSEPYAGSQKILYRIRLQTAKDIKTSQVVILSQGPKEATIISVVNPFTSHISIDIKSPEAGRMRVDLLDNNGIIAGNQDYTITAGNNRLQLNAASNLPSGFYTLRIFSNGEMWTKKMLKL